MAEESLKLIIRVIRIALLSIMALWLAYLSDFSYCRATCIETTGGVIVQAMTSPEGETTYVLDGGGSEIIGRFDRRFAALDSLIFGGAARERLSTRGAADALDVDSTPAVSAQLDAALRANTLDKIREGNGKTGLEITGQTYYRLKGNGGYEDETGEGHYRAKFQAELRWYIFQSSLLGQGGRRRVAALEEEIDRAGYEKERTDIYDFRLKHLITEHYDSLLAGVLRHRVALLRLLDEAQNYLLTNENISSDELVRTLNERMDAERKLSEIEREWPAALTLRGVEATTVRIDSAALVAHVAESQGDMRLLELRMELLTERERNVKWWEDFRLAPFLRYARYFRSGLPDSYNVDAGVTFTIPINSVQRHRRQTLRGERAVLEAERERLGRRVADKTALVVAETAKLDRASRSEVARAAELRGYLARRVEAYGRTEGEHNRLARAREYGMYLACLERLIEYQYRRDCLLADLQALLPGESVMRFISFAKVKD